MVVVATNDASLDKRGFGKFLDGYPFDVRDSYNIINYDCSNINQNSQIFALYRKIPTFQRKLGDG